MTPRSMPLTNVVYVLGAGFSAPLGLPVMRDFLLKAKDMYAVDSTKYEHFQEVFRKLDMMATIKNYFSSDLFNIEEILSILEIRRQMGGSGKQEESFKKFIKDVIEYYTPKLKVEDEVILHDPYHHMFGEQGAWGEYGFFVLSLLGLRINTYRPKGGEEPTVTLEPLTLDTNYSIVTLNYDVVLEEALEHACAWWKPNGPPAPHFRKTPGGGKGVEGPILCKLHGCVRTNTIVPPTWNKALQPEIADAWRQAEEVLREANYIRFLGYSLPDTDTYLRYLLKSALIGAPNLKGIDAICLDNEEGALRRRYDELITFPYFRFNNGDVESYLGAIRNYWIHNRTLEDGHRQYWKAKVGN